MDWNPGVISDEMKKLEKDSLQYTVLPDGKPYVLRLDGNSFTTFTRYLHKPFDVNFVRAMVCTMNDLTQKFNAASGYSQSDEITLIFPKQVHTEAHSNYGGRVFKLLSVVAGYAAARFNYHLSRYILPDPTYGEEVKEEVRNFNKVMDCRVIVFETDVDVFKHMFWRSAGDCSRNAVTSFMRKVYPHKSSHSMKQGQMIEMLERRGLSWKAVPLYCKQGVWGKRVMVRVKGYNPVVEEEVDSVRRRVVNFTSNMRHVATWGWMLEEELLEFGVGQPLGLKDGSIRELMESSHWYPPVLADTGELVHPELLYKGDFKAA